MRPLGPTYAKNGFSYKVLTRHGNLAIAQQQLRPGVGCLAFEVIRVKQVKEGKMFDKVIEAHEAPPGNEEWGRHGWTYPTLTAARAKLRALEVDSEG